MNLKLDNSFSRQLIGEEGDDSGMSDKVVLVIEDEPTILFAFQETVLRKGFTCVSARDGREGLAKARELNPDLIITDIVMPKLDGLSLCAALKGDPAYSHIPIIVVTARSQYSDYLAVMEAGADAFIEKPFKLEDLRREIDRCLVA